MHDAVSLNYLNEVNPTTQFYWFLNTHFIILYHVILNGSFFLCLFLSLELIILTFFKFSLFQ